VNDAVAALARAKLAVVPLLSGSGTRFKILEAWAAGRAVVSTTLGAEGLDARDGEHLVIADDAETFATAIARLLQDDALRARLGSAGAGALSRSLHLAGGVARARRWRGLKPAHNCLNSSAEAEAAG
jgi:glycosyltransferase involved in cell wall biosynthesis